MLIFTVIFGRFVGVSSDGAPYPVFALAALVPWSYFATALNGASTSLTYSTHLVTRVYFPRLVIPSAPVLAGLVDFGAAFLALLAFMFAFGIAPTAGILAVPLLLLLLAMTALGVGCWLAALNIQYRDFRHVTTFLVQIWMYASPIVYPLSVVPPEYRTLYAVNPVVGAVAGFRAALLGTPGPSGVELAVSAAAASVLLLTGVLYFTRTERFFADVA
jgi:lipopolysaccharide transport system permease protein